MKDLLDIAVSWTEGGPAQLPVRTLFTAAGVGLVVVDLAAGTVAEANPAALALLGLPVPQLVGRHWLEAFSLASANLLAATCPPGQPPATGVTLPVEAAAGGRRLVASVTSFIADGRAYLLLRLEAMARAGGSAPPPSTDVLAALEHAPAAFAVTDAALRVEYGNRAFLALVRAGSPDGVRGRSLAQWFALTAADLDALQEQMACREATHTLTTCLHGGGGAPCRVELTAVAVPDGPVPCWGFTFRRLDEAPGTPPRAQLDA